MSWNVAGVVRRGVGWIMMSMRPMSALPDTCIDRTVLHTLYGSEVTGCARGEVGMVALGLE